MLSKSNKPLIAISIARGALESVFDECDRYDVDETGGRLIGTYSRGNDRYDIEVKGVLDPGPKATRSPTSLFQDGEYQERMFRAIEAAHPEIEHLGSWHTHHVNGCPTLSSGDKTTYFKTVNHLMYNVDFFYALLVVSKNRGGDPRYAVRHFVFHRNDNKIYEIPAEDVRLVDTPALRPGDYEPARPSQPVAQISANPERAKDQEFFTEFYPTLKPLISKSIGTPYWKGPLTLVDGSQTEVAAMENPGNGTSVYSIATTCKNPAVSDIVAKYKQRQFRSARHAIIHFERDLNQALFRAKKPSIEGAEA